MTKSLNFLFHEVTDNPNNSGLVRKSALPFKHSIAQFEEYLKVLNESGFKSEGDQHHKETKFSISFDDGGQSNVHSADSLINIGIKAHFFIITKFIDQPGFMTRDDIRYLHSTGHVIGSHSHSHPNVFKNLSYEEMLAEWTESKLILEEILNDEVSMCSVPGGDVSANTYKSAFQAGYKTLFDSEPIPQVRDINGLEVHGRFCLKNTHSAELFEKWLHGKGLNAYARQWYAKKKVENMVLPIICHEKKIRSAQWLEI